MFVVKEKLQTKKKKNRRLHCYHSYQKKFHNSTFITHRTSVASIALEDTRGFYKEWNEISESIKQGEKNEIKNTEKEREYEKESDKIMHTYIDRDGGSGKEV